MKVQFIKVGRYQKTWEATLKMFDWASLFGEVKKNAQVMSGYLYFDFDDATGEGDIFVGAGRKIGSFKVVEE